MKHPFSPSVTLPAELDNTGFTVMAYTAPAHGWVVTVTGNANSYDFSSSLIQPRTLMLGDMLALQATYGANASTRTGSDNYSWQPGERFLETLWDAGGVDTIDASSQTLGNVISLVAGTYSSIGLRRTHTELMADFPAFARASIAMAFTDAELHDGSNNLAIAYGVEIENAIGGAGADLITGNSLANRLTGGGGNDTLDGGADIDTAVFSGSRSAYTITRDVPNARFVVTALSGPDGTDQVKNVELLQFADSTTVLASLASDTGIVDGFNTYRYLASNADLLAAFGSNAPVALAHFINQGYGEGRGFAAFNAVAYLASNPDLLAVYGPNPGAAAEHFVRWGSTEGRPRASFDRSEEHTSELQSL